jgi:DNA polymerase-3 subunit gamma/tau
LAQASVEADATQESVAEEQGGKKSNSAVIEALAAHNEWGALVEQSELIGMTRQLAMNCACERLLEDRVELALSPKLQHLHKPERLKDIEQELRRLRGQVMAVELTVEDSDKETPAECLERLGIERTSQIKADIEQQPGVQALMSEFGATIVEQSIKPIDS